MSLDTFPPKAGKSTNGAFLTRQECLKITEIDDADENRFTTGFSELDRVLGGGMVEGSLTLISGEPGIGKSTIITQAAAHISERSGRTPFCV